MNQIPKWLSRLLRTQLNKLESDLTKAGYGEESYYRRATQTAKETVES